MRIGRIAKIVSLLFVVVMLNGCYSNFWNDVAREITTSPNGHKIAISCHNCYSAMAGDESGDLVRTLSSIHDAQNLGVDLIELDVVSDAGLVYVSHGGANDYLGPKLVDVLADTAFKNGDQMLFMELKKTTSMDTLFFVDLYSIIFAAGYASPVRPVIIRSFDENALNLAKSVLGSNFSGYTASIKFSLLYGGGVKGGLETSQNHIIAVSNKFHMVEFARNTKNLFSYISVAKTHGLGVNIFTYDSYVEVWSAAYRNEIDAITIEGGGSQSRAQNLTLAKSVITADTSLLYTNTDRQNGGDNNELYYFDRLEVKTKPLNTSGFPVLELLGVGEDRFGGSLVFNKNQANYIRFHDVDNDASGGYLVSAVVNFDDLNVSNTTQVIIGKADGSGFSLELYESVLRFGVHINGAYRYATYPITKLNGTDSYHIVGAYDGHGSVRIWVNDEEGSATASYSGGVTRNGSAVVVGADPQGNADQRFYFSGKVQLVNVQKWNNH